MSNTQDTPDDLADGISVVIDGNTLTVSVDIFGDAEGNLLAELTAPDGRSVCLGDLVPGDYPFDTIADELANMLADGCE